MTDAQEFDQLDHALARLLQVLSPSVRQSVMRQVARDLVVSNRQRMARQQDPDGKAWEPRKPQARQGKVAARKAMMTKLRQARRLKGKATADEVVVGWTGGDARIASLHHHGGADLVDRKRSDVRVRYPARPLIGLGRKDVDMIKDRLLSLLDGHNP